MDLQDNYIVTSHEGSPSSFVSNFANPIRVEHGHKMALRSIYYGPRMNVTDENNRLYLYVDGKVTNCFVKKGWYPTIYDLCVAIADGANAWITVYNQGRKPKLKLCTVKFITVGTWDNVQITFDEKCSAVHSDRGGVFTLIDLPYDTYEDIIVENIRFCEHYPAFVYVNVIENSYINNKPSRLFAIVPLQSGYMDGSTGYHFHVFNSPTYYNFAIREFSHVLFQLVDEHAKLIEFAPKYKTIIALEIFKPLDISL